MKTAPLWILLLSSTLIPLNSAGMSPEEETKKISEYLRPLANSEWEQIANQKLAEIYQIETGDSLYKISERLFGDGRYWPKIWAINNGNIINPHLIYPGNSVAFSPGSATTLPSVNILGGTLGSNGSSSNEVADASGIADRSQEWKNLPQQSWEVVTIALPPEVDPQGFDRRNRVTFSQSTGFALKAFAASGDIPFLGVIVASEKNSSFLGPEDIVFIEANTDLEVGKKYSITRKPTVLKHPGTERIGLSYLNLGTIRIIEFDQKEGLYLGRIDNAKHPIARGNEIIPLIERAKEIAPTPGPSRLEALLLVDRNVSSTYTTSQHKFVFLDRGSVDGIQPGMVFRAYNERDPNTKEPVSRSDHSYDGDFIVIQVSPEFSAAIGLQSSSTVSEGRIVTLLTDISSANAAKVEGSERTGFNEESSESDTELDEELDESFDESLDEELDAETDENDLDQLDPGGALTPEEEKELKQLENWEGTSSEESFEDDFELEEVDSNQTENVTEEIDETFEDENLEDFEVDDSELDEEFEEENPEDEVSSAVI